MFVCICQGVTEHDIQALGAEGIRSPEALIEALDLEGPRCCGRCANNIEEITEIARRPLPTGNLVLRLVLASAPVLQGA